jgi:methylmalonyl-CoA/ethylmalonyl-CoA epimerase
MLGQVNHIAIAVPDMNAAIALYQTMGATVSETQALPDHGVTVAFVELANTKIELLHPLGENSPISSFLKRNPTGGIHHLCFEVDDLEETVRKASAAGIRILGSGGSRIGAHGLPVIFVHPTDFFGTLVEFEQVSAIDHAT